MIDPEGLQSVVISDSRETNEELVVLLSKTPWKTLYLGKTQLISVVRPYLVVSLDKIRAFVYSKLKNIDEYINLRRADPTVEFLDNQDNYHIFICFEGAEYIARLWTFNQSLILQKDLQPTALEQVRYFFGVYYCELNVGNVEGHAFVLDCQKEKIIVSNSYGGFCGFYVTEFAREDWISRFLSFNHLQVTEKKRYYHVLWGFTPEMVKSNVKLVRKDTVFQDFRSYQIY